MMTPRLSGLYSIFGLVFFVLKSLPGIARQWSRETFVILFLKPGLILEFNISNVRLPSTISSIVIQRFI